MLLRSLVLLLLFVPRAARADACWGPGHVRLDATAEADRATVTALEALLPESREADATWVITIDGPHTVLQHRSGDRFARTLDASSSPYARASAAAELLTAARAAVCPSAETPENQESAGADSDTLTFALGLGARFDADVDGPWLVRPTAFAELWVPLSSELLLAVGLEAQVLGFYERATPGEPSYRVRYERHDVAASLALGLRVGTLLFSVRVMGGLTIRDVTALGPEIANRLDIGPMVGAGLSLRVGLVGPLGLRVGADLLAIPEVFTYRVRGAATVSEQPIRVAAYAALDLAF